MKPTIFLAMISPRSAATATPLPGCHAAATRYGTTRYTAVLTGSQLASVAGDTVVSELTWEGTPNDDVEGFAKKGETVKLELACIWTIRAGRVVDYHDYG